MGKTRFTAMARVENDYYGCLNGTYKAIKLDFKYHTGSVTTTRFKPGIYLSKRGFCWTIINIPDSLDSEVKTIIDVKGSEYTTIDLKGNVEKLQSGDIQELLNKKLINNLKITVSFDLVIPGYVKELEGWGELKRGYFEQYHRELDCESSPIEDNPNKNKSECTINEGKSTDEISANQSTIFNSTEYGFNIPRGVVNGQDKPGVDSVNDESDAVKGLTVSAGSTGSDGEAGDLGETEKLEPVGSEGVEDGTVEPGDTGTVEPGDAGTVESEDPVEPEDAEDVETEDSVEPEDAVKSEDIGTEDPGDTEEPKDTSTEDPNESDESDEAVKPKEEVEPKEAESTDTDKICTIESGKSGFDRILDLYFQDNLEERPKAPVKIEAKPQNNRFIVTDETKNTAISNNFTYLDFYNTMLDLSDTGDVLSIPRCLLGDLRQEILKVLSSNISQTHIVTVSKLKGIVGILSTQDEKELVQFQIIWKPGIGDCPSIDDVVTTYNKWKQSRKYLD